MAAPLASACSARSVNAAAVEEALVEGSVEELGVGEQTDHERADETADEVHADDVECVVVAGLELDLHGVAADEAGNGTDEDRGTTGHVAGSGGDRHETGDDAGRGTEVGRVTVTDPFDEHPHEPGSSGGEERVHEGLSGLAVGGEGGTGVEAEPTEPEDSGADHDERHRVRRAGLGRPALALAEDQHGGERGDAGVDVNGGATGEVERAAHAEPAAVHPLEHGYEHDQDPERYEDRPRRELDAVGDGARDERRGDRREHAEEGDRRDRPAGVVARDADAVEHQEVEVADVLVTALGERVSEHHPHDRHDEEAIEVHHQHVQHIAALVHPSVEEGEARGHEKDECC